MILPKKIYLEDTEQEEKMYKILSACMGISAAMAAKAGEVYTSSWSFSSSSFTDANGRTITDTNEDSSEWGQGNDGQILVDNQWHSHDGSDSDRIQWDPMEAQVIDMTDGAQDVRSIRIMRGTVATILVDCDASG